MAAARRANPITPDTLRFLSRLRRNNRREWFAAHRTEYETLVRDPLRVLVEEMDVRLAGFTPEIVGDPRRSVFRIHRDVRFSKDKSPYKTNAACWFFHQDAGRQVGREGEGGSAGFYLHLEPGACFLGGGIWMPPRGALAAIREALADDHRPFERIVQAPAVRRRFGGLEAEARLVRMPRGYRDDHPAASWLKYQSFTLGRALTDRQATGSRLPALLAKDYEALTPLVRWLNRAIGLEPATRRRP